jgi:hypothetical protein
MSALAAQLAADAKALNDKLEARVRAPRRDFTEGAAPGVPHPRSGAPSVESLPASWLGYLAARGLVPFDWRRMGGA